MSRERTYKGAQSILSFTGESVAMIFFIITFYILLHI